MSSVGQLGYVLRFGDRLHIRSVTELARRLINSAE